MSEGLQYDEAAAEAAMQEFKGTLFETSPSGQLVLEEVINWNAYGSRPVRVVDSEGQSKRSIYTADAVYNYAVKKPDALEIGLILSGDENSAPSRRAPMFTFTITLEDGSSLELECNDDVIENRLLYGKDPASLQLVALNAARNSAARYGAFAESGNAKYNNLANNARLAEEYLGRFPQDNIHLINNYLAWTGRGGGGETDVPYQMTHDMLVQIAGTENIGDAVVDTTKEGWAATYLEQQLAIGVKVQREISDRLEATLAGEAEAADARLRADVEERRATLKRAAGIEDEGEGG